MSGEMRAKAGVPWGCLCAWGTTGWEEGRWTLQSSGRTQAQLEVRLGQELGDKAEYGPSLFTLGGKKVWLVGAFCRETRGGTLQSNLCSSL